MTSCTECEISREWDVRTSEKQSAQYVSGNVCYQSTRQHTSQSRLDQEAAAVASSVWVASCWVILIRPRHTCFVRQRCFLPIITTNYKSKNQKGADLRQLNVQLICRLKYYSSFGSTSIEMIRTHRKYRMRSTNWRVEIDYWYVRSAAEVWPIRLGQIALNIMINVTHKWNKLSDVISTKFNRLACFQSALPTGLDWYN